MQARIEPNEYDGNSSIKLATLVELTTTSSQGGSGPLIDKTPPEGVEFTALIFVEPASSSYEP